MRRRNLLTSLFAAVGLAAVAMAPAAAATPLYDNLGGDAGLKHIVDALLEIALADDRIKATFDNTNIERLKGKLVEEFCMVSGGPCQYHGVSIKGAHRGLDINEAGFNALVEDLETAMDRTGIGYWTQNRFLALLAPMRRDVVTR